MIDDPEKPFKVKLGKWNGTVAVVTVNGSEAGIIFTNPWEIGITGMLNEGENNIAVTVIGSLKNLLGPHHNISRQGFVTPWSFKFAPETQPPGEAYDLQEYGLFEDFTLLTGMDDPS